MVALLFIALMAMLIALVVKEWHWRSFAETHLGDIDANV